MESRPRERESAWQGMAWQGFKRCLTVDSGGKAWRAFSECKLRLFRGFPSWEKNIFFLPKVVKFDRIIGFEKLPQLAIKIGAFRNVGSSYPLEIS
jgi:hypothetical protein